MPRLPARSRFAFARPWVQSVRHSLRLKASLVAAALGVALLFAAGALQYHQLEHDIRGLVTEQLDTLGESIAEDLSAKLETHVAIVEHVASTLDAETLADRARAQQFVSKTAATRPLFDGTAIISTDGVVLFNDPPLAADRRVALGDRPYFRRVRAEGRTVISEPLIARTGAGPTVLIITPVRDAGGNVLAYFAGGLHLARNNMLGNLAKASLGRTGHFEVVTLGAAPVYVVHPDPARLLQPAAPAGRGALEMPYLTVDKPLRGVDWRLRLALPEWEADVPLFEARRRLVGTLALIGLAAAACAWFAMARLLRPLTALRDTMERLRAAPDGDERIDLDGDDERGDLARAFAALMHETRLRQAETTAIFERSPLGMFRAAPDGRLTHVNAAYLDIHGLAADEAAEGWLTLVPARERAAAERLWREAVRRAEPFYAVRQLVRRDGRPLDAVVRSAPVVVDGRVVGHVGTVFDATERNRQEKAYRVLSTIFETTPDYVVQTDRHGRVTYANPAMRRLLRITADADASRLDASAFRPRRSIERFAAELLPVLHQYGHWRGEEVVLDADGREVPVDHLVIAHRNARGTIDHYSAVMRDISAESASRREAESAAAALRAVSELSPSALTVVDTQLRYRYVNGAFEQRTGRTREQLLGRHAADVLSADDYKASLPHAERALTGEVVEFERESHGAGGRRIHAVSYIPIRLPSGEVDGLVGTAQDITQHRLEAERLRDLSQRDTLTGALNRAGFRSRLDDLVARGEGRALALLYLDLDRFKPVNDEHGHAAGDAVLRAVARRLQRGVRPTDIVARLGGDEFVVLLPGMPEESVAQSIAAKLAHAVAQPVAIGGGSGVDVSIGASIGVVHALQAGEDAEGFLARADRAMFAVKRSSAAPRS